MSLINDALKKAQKQRTGDSLPLASLPSVGGESAARIAKRAKPVGFNSQLIRLAVGGGGVVLVILLGAFLISRLLHKPVAGPGQNSPQPATAPSPAKASTTETAPAAITFKLPIAPPPAPEPAPAVGTSITASAGSESVAAAKLPAAPPGGRQPSEPAQAIPTATPAAEPVPVKLDEKSINYVENLRIAGIRASATDSKVLMNDHVYRIGDIVEHNLGLKLTGITASSLTFEDERGAVYTRNF